MTQPSEEQLKREPAVEKAVVKTPEVISSPHDILGKEYEFNGVSFVMLGIEPVFFGDDNAIEDLQSDTVTFVNDQKQRIPVIPFQGGMARITKIQIGEEVIVGYVEIIKHIEIVDQAPEGWMTNAHLAVELGVSDKTIKSRSESFRESHPEWFCNYLSPRGRVREYFSIELSQIITEDISRIKQSPEGWKTNMSLADELKVGELTIRKHIAIHKSSHPEWFHDYKIPTGQVHKHYSPELCLIIKSELYGIEQAPEGWRTNRSIANELDAHEANISRLAQRYHGTHPEWFKDYKSSSGQVRSYYSPELCSIIRSEVTNLEHAPRGWMTNNRLMLELSVSITTIRIRANSYRQLNPEWFREYRSPTGQVHEHYSPELCAIILKKITDRELAPDGWMTNKKLAQKLGVDRTTISIRTDAYRSTHPEWFCEYMAGNSKISEHYSPKLCEIICNEIKKTGIAPNDWKTNRGLATTIGIKKSIISRCADQYRSSHPEWFKKYKARNGSIFEHYAPELCDLIRKAVKDKRL